MPFSDLSQEQKDAFYARLDFVGIDPANVVDHIGPDTHQGPVVLSADPSTSAIVPHIRRVETVDEMKAATGNLDEHYDTGLLPVHHAIPEPWPDDRGDVDEDSLNPDDRAAIHHAHQVWLYGDSKSVQSYRDVINALEYPLDVPVFAALELNITAANSPFVIDAQNSGHVYGVVTIYDGGSIEFRGNVDLNCQRMVQSDQTGPVG